MSTWTKSTAMIVACALAFGFSATEAFASERKKQKKRDNSDRIARETLDELFVKEPASKEFYEKCHGYAVFSNIKVSLGITAGGGNGVAVNKETGERTYMNMGTAGLNLGLGGQRYYVVFFFETEQRFNEFVNNGWEADASANAAAGKHGANAEATFRNGMAFYQLTGAGLMLQADISGTKYWKDKDLNESAK